MSRKWWSKKMFKKLFVNFVWNSQKRRSSNKLNIDHKRHSNIYIYKFIHILSLYKSYLVYLEICGYYIMFIYQLITLFILTILQIQNVQSLYLYVDRSDTKCISQELDNEDTATFTIGDESASGSNGVQIKVTVKYISIVNYMYTYTYIHVFVVPI
mgnify:CR=1 FL=1